MNNLSAVGMQFVNKVGGEFIFKNMYIKICQILKPFKNNFTF